MWKQSSCAKDKVLYLTKIDEGNGERCVQYLYKDGNLWWAADKSMYVYYTPTHIQEV